MNNNISEHISYIEATNSITAKRHNIDNTPNKEQLSRMKELADNIFEPLRKGLGNKPINIAIFYRSPELNEKIKGAKNSQHMALNGAAIDLDNDSCINCSTNKELFDYIKDNLEFDQLIWEFGDDSNPGWVHVSYNKGKNRKQVLLSKKVDSKTVYYNYEVYRKG